MPTIKVRTQSGGDSGSLELGASVFEAEHNAVLVREVYNAHMANQRQGTHSTKTRGHVSGGGKKPWKQKHTGRARQGSIRAPQWRGGAIVFGPLPRDYREKTNTKKRQGAFRAVLSSKLAAGEIIAVQSLDFPAGSKTKSVIEALSKLGAKGKTLIVTATVNEGLVRAAANLAGSATTPARVLPVNALSIFDLLACETLVITKDALANLEARLAK